MAWDQNIEALLGVGCRLSDHRRGQELDRDALLTRSAKRAAWLLEQRCARGDRIVIAARDPLQIVVDLFACWQAGLVAVLVNPAIVAGERQRVTQATNAKLWVDEQTAESETTEIALEPLHLNEPALILMTSGTTGCAKGGHFDSRSASCTGGAATGRISETRHWCGLWQCCRFFSGTG